ncbi:Na+/H+ antiporter subunit E [Zhihengliuella flava]|uniref:Multicomponent Na+:H+ antiporter subunit E n=1 Tax=Zhihengliuella flava TaxID=1285193 RepID=A0A931D902_9MICC|nr:Na+/H+ antiporter subunit E [Zhihengliuella flava]MBG6084223.1 multicomponent Na+:H+ antiporter subunit E [Zhihengliuella flava]
MPPLPANPAQRGRRWRHLRALARRRRRRFLVELPLLIGMTALWGALWIDFSAGNLIFGFLISLVIVSAFRLPPVHLSGRFNLWHALVFVVRFLGEVVVASFVVLYLSVVRGPRVRSAIVGVPLRSHDDLVVTLTGHTLSLIPGSVVVEVDRRSATLYMHVLNVETKQDAEAFRESARATEARLLRVMGTRDEVEALAREESSC